MLKPSGGFDVVEVAKMVLSQDPEGVGEEDEGTTGDDDPDETNS